MRNCSGTGGLSAWVKDVNRRLLSASRYHQPLRLNHISGRIVAMIMLANASG
jgi:hypothetical protein